MYSIKKRLFGCFLNNSDNYFIDLKLEASLWNMLWEKETVFRLRKLFAGFDSDILSFILIQL